MDHKFTSESITQSAYRAVAGDAQGEATFGGAQISLVSGDRRLAKRNKKYVARLPHVRDQQPLNTQSDIRGAADAAALYRRYHDEKVQEVRLSNHEDAGALFNVLEQVRCEALGAREMDGVAHNLAAALEAACIKRKYDKADEATSPIPMEDGIYTLAFEQMTGQGLLPAAHKAADAWRGFLADKLGTHAFDELIPHLHDQKAFAKLAAKFIQDLLSVNGRSSERGQESQNADEQADSDQSQDEANQSSDGHQSEQSTAASDEAGDASQSDEAGQSDDLAQQLAQAMDQLGDHLPPDQGMDEASNPGQKKQWKGGNTYTEDHRQYPVYTQEYDEIAQAQNLADTRELAALRDKLDGQLESIQALINKLANRLQRILMAQQQRRWRFDEEEGILNTARLARMVADPSITATYKREIETEFQDTVLTLLIDNSGSMRGRPITVAALTTDILAKTLERCGIKVEILGFTTVSWKGGKSRIKWTENGRPQKPGRLNDIRHIIYKGADTPLRRAKDRIALMLKEGILKENIDGEALLWAYQRLKKRPEQRKILMVISDGAPVDDSTLSANDSSFLERDLRHIIGMIADQKHVELTAIGIGHDVGKYYKNAVTIRDVNDLPPVMMNELARLFQKS